MGNWHPLTLLSHILDYQLFGPNPVGHHFVNLLFHITNALLLFWILTNLTGVTWPSAFVAAVFALHPVHVESVAWAAERKDVLSGLFWMLTMAAYIRYARRPGTGRYVLLLLVYGLGIMTKPVVVTLPLVLLLLDYWPLGRFQRNTTPKVSLARLIKEKIPLLLLAVY
jgi:4-amino-4-deoxy-L-arabinose transferase-like glycosyltransferase